MPLRPAEELLTRARICALTSMVGTGFPVLEAAADVARHELGPALTEDERRWLAGDADGADPWIGDVAIMLAWALGLSNDLEPDLDGVGHVIELLFTPSPPVRARPDEAVTAMRNDLTAIAASGPTGREAVRWRLAALHWALDPTVAWPPV